MEILKEGAFTCKPEKAKRFECVWCGCIWVAGKDEYEEDWSKHSIPAYMECPYCHTVMYSLDSMQDGKPRERK